MLATKLDSGICAVRLIMPLAWYTKQHKWKQRQHMYWEIDQYQNWVEGKTYGFPYVNNRATGGIRT